MGSFSVYNVSDTVVVICRRFTTHVISYALNAIHAQIFGKFVLLLLCSKGVKISVIYRYIGDWNKQKIGIGKFKNMHIGATLVQINNDVHTLLNRPQICFISGNRLSLTFIFKGA